jgi:amino acid adenylation domain-containing protein
LLAWSHAPSPAPRPYQSIVAQIEQQAAARPEATAVQLDHQQLTYAALERQVNQLAHALLRRGLQPGDVVGLYLERSLDAIVGMLAILKAGGVYLPLETGLPAERLAYMLADAQVKILLTIDDTIDDWRFTIDDLRLAIGDLRLASGPVVVCVDGEREAIAQEAATAPAVSLAEADPAYLIYTSGSTGAPKGVLIGHGALAQHIPDVAAHFDITPQDRVLQFAALSFDQSVEQILATLASGATLVMRGPDIWPPADFSQVIADAGLTIINLPPIYWTQWLQAGAERMRVIPAGQLKLVIIGGDVMLGESLRLWREAIAQVTPLRAARLLNAYGPTETTITAMTYAVPNDFAEDRIPIGRPLPQRAIFILDQHGNLLPPTVPGELHIGGAGLALGYLNRPDLTADKFVAIDDLRFLIDDWTHPNRQSLIANRKLYRTGDLARFLPDGNVKFLGRVDNQVKVRGFRIELGEIEAVLSQCAGVWETAVVVREDVPGDKRIVAYIVAAEPAPTIDDLRAYLQAKLPDYMVPAAFVIQDAFPLTPSGKIDRRALPAPDLTAALAETYVAPRTPLEEDLVAMWANVLKVERVGIHDNFFDLGGHSLIATQLIARVRAEFQVDLPLRRLFETPTIAGLAELITASLLEETDADELAQLVAELDGLSPEEVAQLLNSEA